MSDSGSAESSDERETQWEKNKRLNKERAQGGKSAMDIFNQQSSNNPSNSSSTSSGNSGSSHSHGGGHSHKTSSNSPSTSNNNNNSSPAPRNGKLNKYGEDKSSSDSDDYDDVSGTNAQTEAVSMAQSQANSQATS